MEIENIIYVQSVDISRNIITIKARMEIKKYAKDKKIVLTTRHIVEALEKDFIIVEKLKESKISNWDKKNCNYTRDGIWQFKIKKKTNSKKTKVKKEVESTGPKVSIRGRMSKIAKEKIGNP